MKNHSSIALRLLAVFSVAAIASCSHKPEKDIWKITLPDHTQVFCASPGLRDVAVARIQVDSDGHSFSAVEYRDIGYQGSQSRLRSGVDGNVSQALDVDHGDDEINETATGAVSTSYTQHLWNGAPSYADLSRKFYAPEPAALTGVRLNMERQLADAQNICGHASEAAGLFNAQVEMTDKWPDIETFRPAAPAQAPSETKKATP